MHDVEFYTRTLNDMVSLCQQAGVLNLNRRVKQKQYIKCSASEWLENSIPYCHTATALLHATMEDCRSLSDSEHKAVAEELKSILENGLRDISDVLPGTCGIVTVTKAFRFHLPFPPDELNNFIPFLCNFVGSIP